MTAVIRILDAKDWRELKPSESNFLEQFLEQATTKRTLNKKCTKQWLKQLTVLVIGSLPQARQHRSTINNACMVLFSNTRHTILHPNREKYVIKGKKDEENTYKSESSIHM